MPFGICARLYALNEFLAHLQTSIQPLSLVKFFLKINLSGLGEGVRSNGALVLCVARKSKSGVAIMVV